MSYVVLARKYRPRRFAEMVGQEPVVQALTNALTQQRLHHAYLFTGTRGIGKTTVSRILAKSLNCTGPDGNGGVTADPCGVCQACTEIDADRYLDYVEMDAASHGGKDDIRDLIERAAYKPGIGRFKVFMIDESHQLSKDAFNALLKTLEEPPEYLKFVLATTDPEKMLPTVLSRCLQFNLRPMAPETVREHLRGVLGAESVGFDEGSLRLLARAARGSMRDGLSLTDQAIAYGGGRLDEAGVRAMLGSVDRSHARTIVGALARRDGAAVLAAIDALRTHGLSPAGTLDEMSLLLQQMAVQQAVPGAVDADDPDTADVPVLAAALPADETQLLYSIVLHGRAELPLMSDEYGALTMVLLRFLAFPPAGAAVPAAPAAPAGGSAPAPRPEAARAAAAVPQRPAAPLRAAAPPAMSLPAPAAQPAPRAAAAPGDAGSGRVGSAGRSADGRVADDGAGGGHRAGGVGPGADAGPDAVAIVDRADAGDRDLGDRWTALVARLCDAGAVAALVRELAMQSALAGIDDAAAPPRWRLVVERETLRAPPLKDKLAAAITATLGEPVQLDVAAGSPTDTPARRAAAERQRRQQAAEQSIHDDPVVRELLSQFKGARIVPGSIKPR